MVKRLFRNANQLRRNGAAPSPGIVHFGPGAFFRAHLASYTHDAMLDAPGAWGIVAVSLKSPRARDQLAPQEGVFTAVELGAEGRKARQIGSIVACLVAPEDPGAVIARIADPETRILSLTITEKGYCCDVATGALDRGHPDIAHDLENPVAPRSAVGLITAGLAARRSAGAGPLTVMSCDNLNHNGRVTRAVVLEFARAISTDPADWIASEIAFPSTMVDRITPATTEADLAALKADTGIVDPAAVMHEPFRQWVIEDNFAAGRPDWHLAGAEMVRDVTAHEAMKLRCLNGAHSAMAYLGYLAGHDTIADVSADPLFPALCRKLWAEDVLPTVPQPEGADLQAYCEALLERFANPGIQHRTWQIAMDGSQKLPARTIAPLAEHLANGRVAQGFCLTIAAWMRYSRGIDMSGGAIDVSDPMAAELRALHEAPSTLALVQGFLALDSVFPSAVAESTEIAETIAAFYDAIDQRGPRAAIEAWVK